MTRQTPDRWSMVCAGDVLFDPARSRIFQVEDMTYEHGWDTRISVRVRNVMTGNRVEWTIPVHKQLAESGLDWIGEG